MAKRKRKTEIQAAFDAISGFRDLVDETFERLTGKPIAAWLKEFQQQSKELPPVGPSWPPEPKVRQPILSKQNMPLADAYAILGLKPDAPPEDVKKHYRNLANLFHPDKGGYAEAMRLLNQAHDRITKGKGEK
jgi:hypothetical protein